jgi:hypothetical protein
MILQEAPTQYVLEAFRRRDCYRSAQRMCGRHLCIIRQSGDEQSKHREDVNMVQIWGWHECRRVNMDFVESNW